MSSSNKPASNESQASTVVQVQQFADEADRVFLRMVRALGRATRWAGSTVGQLPAYASSGVKREAPSGLLNGIAKLLQSEAKRVNADLSKDELQRLAEMLATVATGALSGTMTIEEQPAADEEPPPAEQAAAVEEPPAAEELSEEEPAPKEDLSEEEPAPKEDLSAAKPAPAEDLSAAKPAPAEDLSAATTHLASVDEVDATRLAMLQSIFEENHALGKRDAR